MLVRQAPFLLMLIASILGGCSKPPTSYSRNSPEAVLESAALMIQNGEAKRLTELIYAENVQMRSLLNQIGLTFGSMADLADALQDKFPNEIEEVRKQIEADGGLNLIGQLAGPQTRGRRGPPVGGSNDSNRFQNLGKQIFADPYGWLTRNNDKLDVIYIADDTYGVMYDNKPLLQPWGVLIQKQTDGWYLMLPTNLPGAREFMPKSDDEFMIWGSLFKTLENGINDMTRDVNTGRTTSMNQLGQSAVEKFAIPAVMVMFAYTKHREAAQRERREADKPADG
ncbi:MAG: hypothetical protein KF757_11520 [Phycisphaeraceae bacterium]|nr:hypothetical protein [Phycisphaeraceae bacterium]MCW5762316.1 hypothetical protein [Phycisphaeraceae bacterium]